jgi:hypothetical protein
VVKTAATQWGLGALATAALGLSAGFGGAIGSAPARAAQVAQAAPAQVQQVLQDLAAVANDHDLDAVMAFYSPAFTSNTGFTHDQLRQTLETLWQQYPDITYTIELLSWQAAGPNHYALETRTQVTGQRVLSDRTLTLTADITSRQHLEGGQIAQQEILTETSRLVSGDNPPTVQIQLPTTVASGQTYGFDTIVLKPLEGRSLMGVAVEEGVTSDDFFAPRPVTFDLLTAGGLYKLGTAPDNPDQRWVSSVVIREDGMVIETRRLRVE